MDIDTRCLVKLIICFIIGIDNVVLDIPILITRGVFQKSLRIVLEQILLELIDWDRGFDEKSLYSGIYF
jgi:hypothetical protein